jgi:hypothetical protein
MRYDLWEMERVSVALYALCYRLSKPSVGIRPKAFVKKVTAYILCFLNVTILVCFVAYVHPDF